MSSLSLRVGLVVTSTVVSLLAAEGLLRVADGGSLPQPPMYESTGGAGIRLQPNARGNALLALRHPYTLVTGEHGIRAASVDWSWSQPAWLVLGDSQALGLGVAFEETFSARASAAGVPMVSAGVPSYGLEDALRRGTALLTALDPPPTGIVVLVNQANDWDEMGHPVTSVFETQGGWLLPKERTSDWQRSFFRSPLSHLHLPHLLVTVVSRLGGHVDPRPLWSRDPAAARQVTARIATTLASFRAETDLPVLVVYMPLDLVVTEERLSSSPFGRLLGDERPWEDQSLGTSLAEAVPELVDLTPHLDAADFLDGDYHLSPTGHQTVANALVRELTR